MELLCNMTQRHQQKIEIMYYKQAYNTITLISSTCNSQQSLYYL